MDGQIEALSIGGQNLGLWNYKVASDLNGAVARNKLKDEPIKGLTFDGRSYLSVDRSNYQDITNEFYFKVTFKSDRPNGVLLFIGDANSQDYAALEIRNGYLTYSFNLGGDTASLESTMPVEMGVWETVEITRNGRYGEMIVNGNNVGNMASQGDMDQLSIGPEIFVGGFIPGQMPNSQVRGFFGLFSLA